MAACLVKPGGWRPHRCDRFIFSKGAARNFISRIRSNERHMTNPFENEEAEYLVLMNDEGQCSLWSSSCEIPAGWTEVGPRGKRQGCLDWVEANWTDMRPRSLAAAQTRHSTNQ